MQGEQPLYRQLFPAKNMSRQVDPRRIEYCREQQAKQNKGKAKDKAKKVNNTIAFRESLKQQEKNFHQSNHQYLRMCGVISRASRDDNRFMHFGQYHGKINTAQTNLGKQRKAQKKTPLVHLNLESKQVECAVLKDKVPIKDTYNLIPFCKESIIFQNQPFLSADFIFFLIEDQNQKIESLRSNLLSIVQEGISAQFKFSIIKSFKHINYFDYLYFANDKYAKSSSIVYPEYILQIAKQNSTFLARVNEEDSISSIRQEITINEQQTCDRLIVCEQSDVNDNCENLCFQTVDDYSEFKKYQAVNFKKQKIFEKDAEVNTNIRNVISTQKVYMVEIIEEIKSYIELSKECEGTGIMEKVYEQLQSKADEYLRLLCSYTQSIILTTYNIQNYQEKIFYFLQKSIRFKKEFRNPPPSLLKEFPVLQIWYKLPQSLFGYYRSQLHQYFYELMESMIRFEEKLKSIQFYEKLRIKRLGTSYIR